MSSCVFFFSTTLCMQRTILSKLEVLVWVLAITISVKYWWLLQFLHQRNIWSCTWELIFSISLGKYITELNQATKVKYQVQINLSLCKPAEPNDVDQKRCMRLGNFTLNLLSLITLCKSLLTLSYAPPWINIMWCRSEVYRFARRSWFASNIFPAKKSKIIMQCSIKVNLDFGRCCPVSSMDRATAPRWTARAPPLTSLHRCTHLRKRINSPVYFTYIS
jgi:hypothetical protein